MTSSETGMPESARGIGERLRQTRIRAGLTPSEVGSQLKMPTYAIEALEREDWARIGAPVFIRGQLRSYARLLGLPADAIVESLSMPIDAPAELVPQTYTPRMHLVAEQTKMRLVYVVLTAAIAVPVWLATRSHLDSAVDTVSLDADAPLSLPQQGMSPSATTPQQVDTASAARAAPLVASITPPMPQRAVSNADLSVTFSGESWVRVSAPDGTVIEQTLVQPGQQRVFKPGQVGKAVLGNAQAVSMQYRGQAIDLTPYIRANVLRFTVSSDGSLQPVDR
ncbi:MAG: helix-turn-helix domain-containing protein [Lysobacter sp.]|nr:helix-turn-helix domain-containing protein [Lysobacter sp.]